MKSSQSVFQKWAILLGSPLLLCLVKKKKGVTLGCSSKLSKDLCVSGDSVGNEKRSREVLPPVSGSSVSLWHGSCEGTVNSFYLPQHPKAKLLKYFSTFPWIFIPLLNTFPALLSSFFSMMCKVWLKTQLLRFLALLVVSREWNEQGCFISPCVLFVDYFCVLCSA